MPPGAILVLRIVLKPGLQKPLAKPKSPGATLAEIALPKSAFWEEEYYLPHCSMDDGDDDGAGIGARRSHYHDQQALTFLLSPTG